MTRKLFFLSLLFCTHYFHIPLAAQNPCTISATIVDGVECDPISVLGGGLIVPCAAPIGFYFLPVGIPLLINYTPSNCISFCQQGPLVDLGCAQVVGGTNFDLCLGSSIFIGAPAEESKTYLWQPNEFLSCDTCALTIASPPENAIYTRITTIPGLGSVTDYFNVSVSPCSAVNDPTQVNVSVSPVPATDYLTVQGFDFETFVIFDLQGRKMLSGQNSGDQRIVVASLLPGVYFLQLQQKGRQTSIKIVKSGQP